jgi:hypothetical protein
VRALLARAMRRRLAECLVLREMKRCRGSHLQGPGDECRRLADYGSVQGSARVRQKLVADAQGWLQGAIAELSGGCLISRLVGRETTPEATLELCTPRLLLWRCQSANPRRP